MKKFKFMILALVAMCGFSACEKDCDHNFIEVDYNKELVGTWTCFQEGYAEALVINADGSVLSTGVEDGEYWENIKGNIKTINNKMTMTFEDGDNWEGRFEMLSGEAFTIFEENGETFTYNYCANDLSEEIVGMWVFDKGDEYIAITTYSEDGYMITTTQASEFIPGDLVNGVSKYKDVGDLRFLILPADHVVDGMGSYLVARMVYTPNVTNFGDILTHTLYTPSANGVVEVTSSFLRIRQSLNLTGKTYDYNSAYVTNAKGTDEDFSILGHTFNMANIKGGNFDMLFRSELFCIDLNANSITQHFRANGQNVAIEIPTTVEGNKVTLDYSAATAGLRKVDMYMFQDTDDCQLHIYMPTKSFINYFANLEIITMLQEGKLDINDATAIEKVFADMEARVESINVSFTFKARK